MPHSFAYIEDVGRAFVGPTAEERWRPAGQRNQATRAARTPATTIVSRVVTTQRAVRTFWNH
jgi:hypothetical protein